MGARACLLLVAMFGCQTKSAAPGSATHGSSSGTHGSGSAVQSGSAGSAADPWARGSGSSGSASATGSAGSAEPEPTWAHDPPEVLRGKILGVNAHVIVLKSATPFTEYRDVLATFEKTPGIVAAQPFMFMEAKVASATKGPVALALKGVDPKRVVRVLDLHTHLTAGKIDSLATGKPPSIILGDVLAKTLEVKVGDIVTVTPGDPDPNYPLVEPANWKPAKYRVKGTFHFEFDEYDNRLAFTSLGAAQAMVGRGDQVMGIEASVKDLDTSDKTAEAIEKALGGPPYEVMDWYELNRQLFTALYGNRRP
jgi:lipoprotein-releasing system permease protein